MPDLDTPDSGGPDLDVLDGDVPGFEWAPAGALRFAGGVLVALVAPGAGLTSLPEAVRGTAALRRIDLDGNALTALPGWIGRLEHLRVLLLYGNRITAVPPELGRLASLEHLSVGRNALTSVPDALWRLDRLRSLNLAENEIADLPPGLGRLRELRMLDLGHNRLREVPAEIGELPCLTDYLYLSDNGLTSVPASLGRLDRLGYLNLAENRLTALPASIGGMTGLRELRVRIVPLRRLVDFREGSLEVEDVSTGDMETLAIDTLVAIRPNMADNELERALSFDGDLPLGAGDCLAPRTAVEAVFEGHAAGRSIERRS